MQSETLFLDTFTFRPSYAVAAFNLLQSFKTDRAEKSGIQDFNNLVAVGIHVRRTDYAERFSLFEMGNLVSEQYFLLAMDIFR